MSLFKKNDPLTVERRRLEEEQRALEQQIADLEDAMQNPPPPDPPPPVTPAIRGAVFKHDPFATPTVSAPPLKRRTRRVPISIIVLVVVLVVLTVLIARCAS